jgi:methyl-accepting chemotaxis protein
MKLFKNATLASRLILGFLTTVLLMAVIGIVGFISTRNINTNLVGIFSRDIPSLDYLIQTDRDLQQLLVAERSMIFANAASEEFQGLVADYEQNLAQAADRWGKFKAIGHGESEEAIFLLYEQARDEWQAVSKQIVDGRAADTRDGRRLALDLSLGIANEKFEAMRDYLDQLQGMVMAEAEAAHLDAQNTFRTTTIILISTIAGGILLGLALALIITRGVTRQLGGEPKEVLDICTRVADGDLTPELGENRRGALLAMKRMLDSLNELLGQVNASTEQVTSGADQVSQSSQVLSQGATEQASSLEEVASSLDEINSQSTQNAENAKQANALATTSVENAENGNGQMKELVGAIEKISESSNEITKVVKVIDDIAFQINLLALNANVEAARAGKYGKGFAVVAEEVRNLAVRSADAVKETTKIVEDSARNMEDGLKSAETTATQLDEIVQGSTKVADLLGEIAVASDEQAQGVQQINGGLEQIDQVTQSNTASAEEGAAASEELSAQSKQLMALITRFRLRNSGGRRTQQSYVMAAPVTGKINDERTASAATNHRIDENATDPEQVIRLDEVFAQS